LAFDFQDASEFVQKVYDHANRALGVLTVKSKAAGGAYYYESILLCCFELFLWLSVSISDSLVYC